MQLKKLEMHGFKSFATRTEVLFEPGVTGVVGPNGCGKSNVVDAIKWVLGTMSYKAIRGEEMMDVIFKGAPGAAPMGFAEVSLTLETTYQNGVQYKLLLHDRGKLRFRRRQEILKNGGPEPLHDGPVLDQLSVINL